MSFDIDKSEEELKSVFREYLQAKFISEEEAATLVEQIKYLKNTENIQLRMICRSLLGKIDTHHPGKFDLSFINNDGEKVKKSVQHEQVRQEKYPETLPVNSLIDTTSNSQKGCFAKAIDYFIYAFILFFALAIINGLFAKKNEVADNPQAIELVKNSQIEVEKLAGLQFSELKALFPEISEPNSNSFCEIKNWKGWRYVLFSISKQTGQVESVGFGPQIPLSLNQAKKVVTELFGFALDESYLKNSPAFFRYENMPGKIHRVGIHYVDWQHDRRITEISFGFNLK